MIEKPKILIVDDESTSVELLKNAFKDNPYDLSAATNGAEALKMVAEIHPDLILLDIQMPVMNGLEVCRRLKADPQSRNIPILFITASKTTRIDESKGLSLGALDYITKPFDPEVVQARVRNHLELKKHQNHLEDIIEEKTADLRALQAEIFRMMAVAAEFRDNNTADHLQRIELYVLDLLVHMNWENKATRLMAASAATLHDIGKIGIPDIILGKTTPLNSQEWEIMKKHPKIGADIIGDYPIDVLQIAKIIALQHHEKNDGSGYPGGLKGSDISFLSAVTQLADTYDALISKRSYKRALSHDEAVYIIIKGDESGRTLPKHFNPEVWKAFREIEYKFAKIAGRFSDQTTKGKCQN